MSLQPIASVERETLGGRVYEDICNHLRSGQMPPGQVLSLRKMAEAMAVSVMPVRDAVGRLVAEKALVISKNRTIQVPVLTRAQLRELTAVRIEIEGYAAEMAAKNHTDADLDKVTNAALAYEAACKELPPNRRAETMKYNLELHFAIYDACHMPSLIDIISSLWLRAGPLIYLGNAGSLEWLETGGSADKHRRAVEAIRDRKPALARAAIAEDILAAAESVERHVVLAD
ncbi:MAG TPA: GntR family transcriptional regulator [Devosia sp.]|nr:GntR family transcriptional regulator [Devosia sp.]